MDCSLLYESPDFVVLDLSGSMDAKGTGAIQESLRKYAANSSKHLVLDLANLSFLSSIGLRLFLQIAKTLALKELQLVLVAPPPLITTVIDHSAMDKLVPVVQNVEAARDMLQHP